ncbi:hypothetical protein [Amycolatopsis sp. WAC 01376]|uniref:hypothetical protein n=1 Tax=unclassified Amycolatopsis TaxID=2618356 RepID=UPI000F77EFAA|nr:hypothetical protein [Amycolatopsis sp. WAC 01376]RSM62638.1 hypothetical protein DMH03_11220 [Amycolatopsis sp. WAC 01376]
MTRDGVDAFSAGEHASTRADTPTIIDGTRRQSLEALPKELVEALRSGEFHHALRQAIAYRGLSLARLRAHLGLRGVQIGQSTLSYWQRGLRQPEVPKALPAVRALESVLQLPPDALVVLIGPRTTRARGHQMAASFHDIRSGDMGSIVDQLLAELGAYPSSNRYNADLEMLAVHDTITFDAAHRQVGLQTRLVCRARRHGPDRYVTVYNGDPGCNIGDVELITAEGCRVGRIRRNAEAETMATELLFDRKLAEGEIHVFCFEVRDDSGTASPGYFRMLRDQCSSYLVQLKFALGALPARCTRQFRTRDDAVPVESEELPLDMGGVTSGFFSDAGPGLAGIEVEWR